MPRGHLTIPAGTLAQLEPQEVERSWELDAISRVLRSGIPWNGLALPGSYEESFYRLNSLPHQLLPLYTGLDPSDPDEDIVEEAEEAAVALVAEHYLLDESVDLLYDSLTWTGPTTVRRAGAEGGREVTGRRAVLLAVKRIYQDDWKVDAVMERLAATATLGFEARPVLITPAPERLDEEASRSASSALGQAVRAWVDPGGVLVRLAPA